MEPSFREISSRENDQWNLDVCVYVYNYFKVLVCVRETFCSENYTYMGNPAVRSNEIT